MKYDYFKRNWPTDWMDLAEEKVKACFERYRGEEEEVESEMPNMPEKKKKWAEFNAIRFGNRSQREDELKRYLKAPLVVLEEEDDEKFDILEWWSNNSKEYPTLYRIACNIYSIPAMSVEPERVFSGYIPAIGIN